MSPSRLGALGKLSLRTKISLIVATGALIPFTIGLLRIRDSTHAGEDLVRGSLAGVLARDTASLRSRWEYRYSDLRLLSDDPVVALTLAAPAQAAADVNARNALAPRFDSTSGIERIVFFDRTGQRRWQLGSDEPVVSERRAAALGEPLLQVRVPITDSMQTVVGEMQGWVQLHSLLKLDGDGLPDAPVHAIVDRSTGTSLRLSELSTVMATEHRFRWADQQWITERATVAEPPLEIIVAAPVDRFVQPFRSSEIEGALALLAGTALALVLAWFLAGRITASLERVAGAAEAIAGGDLDRRVNDTGTAEIGRVARAFNAMTDSLRRVLGELSQREALAAVGSFASQLAHEVRNPLTSLRIDLERLKRKMAVSDELQETVSRALDQVQRLDQAVGGALAVTQSANFARGPVHLAPVIARAQRVAEPYYAERGADLIVEETQSDGIELTGDAPALERMFANLLINAAEALRSGGHTTVRVIRSNGSVQILIKDDGLGMTEGVLARVGDPFFTTKSKGTGLGLVISRRIVDAHGGTMTIVSSPTSGTQVSVTFPVRPEFSSSPV